MARLPRSYENFREKYPEIWQAYDRLGGLVHDAGPLVKKHRELIKLGMAIGARLEGAVHSHVRRAIEEGATREEIYHVVLLGLTTLGFPTTVAFSDLGQGHSNRYTAPVGEKNKAII